MKNDESKKKLNELFAQAPGASERVNLSPETTERGRAPIREVEPVYVGPSPLTDSNTPPKLYWAMRPMEFTSLNSHLMVIGSTRSGKTMTIQLLMQSLFPAIGKLQKPKLRALVYDAKNDMVSTIYGILKAGDNKDCKVIILNPFDSRAWAWDIAADVTTPGHAFAVASILIPEQPNATQPYFSDAARAILAAVMTAFAFHRKETQCDWTLRDVILSLRNADRISAVASLFPPVADKIQAYLNDDKSLPGVISQISTKMEPFEVVAALWEQCAGKKISLKDWTDPNNAISQSILVLGTAPAQRESLDPINQVLFRRLSDHLLQKQDTDAENTWLFFDEVREAGKLNGLPSLLNRGRSKGVTVVLGFQEIEGLEHVYGDKVASEICGQCGFKTFLKTNSHKTANWVQSHFGEVQRLELERSHTWNPEQLSVSNSMRRHIRHLLFGSELMNMPPTGSNYGFTAIHDLNDPEIGPIRTRATWGKLFPTLPVRSTDKDHQNELRRKDPKEIIEMWGKDDFERFKEPELFSRAGVSLARMR